MLNKKNPVRTNLAIEQREVLLKNNGHSTDAENFKHSSMQYMYLITAPAGKNLS